MTKELFLELIKKKINNETTRQEEDALRGFLSEYEHYNELYDIIFSKSSNHEETTREAEQAFAAHYARMQSKGYFK